MGTWSFGSAEGEYWGEQSQDDVVEVMRVAVEGGLTYINTAEMYQDGRSEMAIGDAIARNGGDHFRKKS